MSRLPRALVFDCDGVLVDSEGAVFAAVVAVFGRRGIDGVVAGPTSSLYGASVFATILELERLLGEPVDVDQVAEELDAEIRANIAGGVVAMDGAIELLEAIRGIAAARHWLPMAPTRPSRHRCGRHPSPMCSTRWSPSKLRSDPSRHPISTCVPASC